MFFTSSCSFLLHRENRKYWKEPIFPPPKLLGPWHLYPWTGPPSQRLSKPNSVLSSRSHSSKAVLLPASLGNAAASIALGLSAASPESNSGGSYSCKRPPSSVRTRLAASCLHVLHIKDLFRQMLPRSKGSRHPQGNPQPMGGSQWMNAGTPCPSGGHSGRCSAFF